MNAHVVEGDLLDQQVEAIVNAWNRNIIPWWLLWPHGVSGAIKKRGGYALFKELPLRPIPLGEAVLTSAGRLPFRGIIHVAGINGFWRASEFSIRRSARSAVRLAQEHRFRSLAMPIIGSGAAVLVRMRRLGSSWMNWMRSKAMFKSRSFASGEVVELLSLD